jgi:hypothetical protein
MARHERLPQKVFAALFGAAQSGDKPDAQEDRPVSESKPVAATVAEIKAAFPKAKSDFIVKCMERALPMASVAAAAAEEMMAENEELTAKCKAMEEELAKYKSMEGEVEEEEEVPTPPSAKANRKPLARVGSGTTGKTSKESWDEAVAAELKPGVARSKALALANRKNPGLREKMLAEVNASRPMAGRR